MTYRSMPRKFRLYLIKPSHYDDDGYVIQWIRSEIPSNSMSVMHSLALDCKERQVLGSDVHIEITTIDEIHSRLKPKRIIRQIRTAGGRALVAIVGLQTNQFPRALDIGQQFRAADIPVCMGGFHISGSLAMIPAVPPEIQKAWDLGISLFAGEAEGRLETILRDTHHGTLKPLYNFLSDLPSLEGAPVPVAPKTSLERNISSEATVDTSRGCPFKCSFCTIINVQGRKSRSRTPEEVAQVVRAHYARGVRALFLTDDNFARNKQWEPILDRLIHLREVEGLDMRLMLQVDTLSHRVPRFIEKAGRAGVRYVFIGLENINPDNLSAAGKKQNRIGEYRAMLTSWKAVGAITVCGYIIGFPNDTLERVRADVETIKRELPIDVAEFFCLTPLPGSQDHKVLYNQGAWLEPDLNKYDLEHVCAEHPRMSRQEWEEAYNRAWESFYSFEHISTVIRRAAATGARVDKIAGMLLFIRASQTIEGVQPMQGGLFRRKYRKDRRHGLPLENRFVFYPRYAFEIFTKSVRLLSLAWQVYLIYRRVKTDPGKKNYTDLALMPAKATAKSTHKGVDSSSLAAFSTIETSTR